MSVTLTALQKVILDAANALLDSAWSGGLINPDTSTNAAALTGYGNLNPNQQEAAKAAMRQVLASLIGQNVDYVPAPFVNGSNYGGGWATAAYAKNFDGDVFLKGLVVPTGNNLLFTLPAGYRPAESHIFNCLAWNGSVYSVARVDVSNLGAVNYSSGPSNVGSWLSLEGIRFRAEQ